MAEELLSGTRACVDVRVAAGSAAADGVDGDASSWSGAQSGGMETVWGAASMDGEAGAGGGAVSVAGWTATVEGAAADVDVGAGAGVASGTGDAARISGSTAGVRLPGEPSSLLVMPAPRTRGAAREMLAAPAW